MLPGSAAGLVEITARRGSKQQKRDFFFMAGELLGKGKTFRHRS
jgi:hypothetical protein